MTNDFSRRLLLVKTAAVGLSTLGLSRPALSEPQANSPLGLYAPTLGVAKLNANENPYGPSPAAVRAMAEASAHGAYYVRRSAQKLREMIAEKHGLSVDHVLLSSGSSGALTYLALAASQKGQILTPDLFWDTTSLMGVRNSPFGIKRLPKNESLVIDLAAMEASLNDDVAMVQITNPNNPTGIALDSEELKRFCRKASEKCVVLVDEAYNELTDDPPASTMIPLVKEGKNVAVARTFSKIYGLAGMRVGYMIAQPDLLQTVSQFGLGDYGLNQAGVAGALESFNDSAFLEYSKSKIVEGRAMIAEATSSHDLFALPSQTNFVFVDLGHRNAEKFRVAMQKRNVMIRGVYRDYTQWSRVSMGRLEDIQMYVDALPAALAEA